MMTLQVVPDRFATAAEALSKALGASPSSTQENHIRRPTRGIVLKEDTFATLRLVAGKGGNVKIVDAGSRRKEFVGDGNQVGYMTMPDGKRATDIYSNFLIQQVQEERVEKSQIVETFGEPYIFLFGERARVMTFTGILANTFDFNWEAEWWHNYEHFLRGTRCVEMDARVFLSFDTTLVGGYIVSTAATKNSEQRNFVQFQFQLFVTSYANFSDVGNPDASPPGAKSFFNIQGQNQGLDAALDPAIAAQFRPKLLADFGRFPLNTGGLKIGSSGLLPDLDVSAIDFAPDVDAVINAVADVWNSAAQIVGQIARGIEDLATNARVRVPIGYEGALEFDEDADINLRTVTVGGPIRYTTFADNEDEYVGASDHYGSADPALVHLQSLTSPTQASEIERGQQMVTRAEEIWKAHGLQVPNTLMGDVASFLVSKGLGLVGVGATKAWTAATEELQMTSLGSSTQRGSLTMPE